MRIGHQNKMSPIVHYNIVLHRGKILKWLLFSSLWEDKTTSVFYYGRPLALYCLYVFKPEYVSEIYPYRTSLKEADEV